MRLRREIKKLHRVERLMVRVELETFSSNVRARSTGRSMEDINNFFRRVQSQDQEIDIFQYFLLGVTGGYVSSINYGKQRRS